MSDNSGLRPLNNYTPGSYERFDNNLADILVDLLQGDTELLNRPEIQSLGVENIRKALEWLSTTQLDEKYKQLITNEGWRLTYKRKPPTPEEFLTYDWIGPQAEGLWPNVKKAFIEYMDPNPLNPKRGLALSTSIGWGKSLLTNLCMSYEIILFCLMHAPYKTLGHSPMTSYALTLASFSLGKVWDLLGTPFEQFIEQSPVFEKVARRDDVVNADKVDPTCSKILYSTAARGSTRMLFRNNLQLRMASSEGHLLGSAQPMYSKIMKPDGSYYTMGEVKVGDVIASPTEGSTVVTGIYPQGPRDIFEIELDDGRKVRASDNHLWKVAIDKNEQGEWNWQVVNTLQLIDWLSQDIEVEIYDEITSEELLKNL